MDTVLLSLAALGASVLIADRQDGPTAAFRSWLASTDRLRWLAALASCSVCASVWVGLAAGCAVWLLTGNAIHLCAAFIPAAILNITERVAPRATVRQIAAPVSRGCGCGGKAKETGNG